MGVENLVILHGKIRQAYHCEGLKVRQVDPLDTRPPRRKRAQEHAAYFGQFGAAGARKVRPKRHSKARGRAHGGKSRSAVDATEAAVGGARASPLCLAMRSHGRSCASDGAGLVGAVATVVLGSEAVVVVGQSGMGARVCASRSAGGRVWMHAGGPAEASKVVKMKF